MNITADMKMADVLNHNFILLPVISRFNIKLGFGDKTVREICSDYGINLDFFIEITNSFVDAEYIPQKELDSFPVSLLIKYLKKTHQYYMEEKIPEIETMIWQMVENMKTGKEKFSLINDFFAQYKKELTNHIDREEFRVLPYVIDLEEAYLNGKISEDLHERIRKYSINDYAKDHDDVEEKLADLKNLIIKYLPPSESPSLCNKILMELFQLERDMNDHASLEDKVLIPKVSGMEKELLAIYKHN